MLLPQSLSDILDIITDFLREHNLLWTRQDGEIAFPSKHENKNKIKKHNNKTNARVNVGKTLLEGVFNCKSQHRTFYFIFWKGTVVYLKNCTTLIIMTGIYIMMAFLLSINIAVFLYTEMFQ